MKPIKVLEAFVAGVKGMPGTKGLLALFLIAVAILSLAAVALEAWADKKEAIPFSEVEIFFEENATDGDLGLQFFLDGDDWSEVTIVSPDGRKMVDIKVKGNAGEIGLTEVFSESAEPSFDDLPREEFLALFPEGEYKFSGKTIEGDRLMGTGVLTHELPVAVSLDLDAYPTVMWTDNSGAGDPEIVGYQVVVELVVEAPEEREFNFIVDLPASATQVTVTDEFVDLADGFDEEEIQEYKVEVIAMEASGNKTITEESLIEEEE
jgi:hypothetical protein